MYYKAKFTERGYSEIIVSNDWMGFETDLDYQNFMASINSIDGPKIGLYMGKEGQSLGDISIDVVRGDKPNKVGEIVAAFRIDADTTRLVLYISSRAVKTFVKGIEFMIGAARVKTVIDNVEHNSVIGIIAHNPNLFISSKRKDLVGTLPMSKSENLIYFNRHQENIGENIISSDRLASIMANRPITIWNEDMTPCGYAVVKSVTSLKMVFEAYLHDDVSDISTATHRLNVSRSNTGLFKAIMGIYTRGIK